MIRDKILFIRRCLQCCLNNYILYWADIVACMLSCSRCGLLSSRCSLLELLSAAKSALYWHVCKARQTKALCKRAKLHVHIITNPQVFCKRENRESTSTSEHCSHLPAFVVWTFFLFLCSSFPTCFPAHQINSSLTRSQGFVKMAIFSLNHKNASFSMCPFFLK